METFNRREMRSVTRPQIGRPIFQIALLSMIALLILGHSGPTLNGFTDGQSRPNPEYQLQSTPVSLGSSLLDAANRGDLDALSLLIAAGADVNYTRSRDGSPLIVAARRGDVDSARLLLQHGSDPNLVVLGDGSPMTAAARGGKIDMVRLLLSHGALIDLVAPGDETPLIQASIAGHLSMVELLISSGADVNMRVWSDPARPLTTPAYGTWRTALGTALKNGHTAVAELLRSVGAKE